MEQSPVALGLLTASVSTTTRSPPRARALLCSIKGGRLPRFQSLSVSPPKSPNPTCSTANPASRRDPASQLAVWSRSELAKLEELRHGATAGETEEQRNKFLVLRLYEALNARDHAAVQALLAPDLEWWFHGPPAHQHMMRILTGDRSSSFRFAPRSVDAFGSTVIAEGLKQEGAYWVHAWTVGTDGVITQLREYFNTDLTVTRLAAAKCVWQSHRTDNSLPGLVLAI